jgi:hypothetical protein
MTFVHVRLVLITTLGNTSDVHEVGQFAGETVLEVGRWRSACQCGSRRPAMGRLRGKSTCRPAALVDVLHAPIRWSRLTRSLASKRQKAVCVDQMSRANRRKHTVWRTIMRSRSAAPFYPGADPRMIPATT